MLADFVCEDKLSFMSLHWIRTKEYLISISFYGVKEVVILIIILKSGFAYDA